MIGTFEIQAKKTGYPVKNQTDIGPIRTLIVTGQSFSFGSEALFQSHAQWIADIKAENIFVLKDLKEIENESEATEYPKSELDYEYTGKPGKYRYTLRAIYSKQYHDHIRSFSGRNLRVFIGDRNYNVSGYLTGGTVKGLDVELFNVEIKKLPGTNEPAWTIIRLVLSEPSEVNIVKTMTWNPNRLDLIHVAITSVSGAGNYVDFTIKDAEFGIEIDHLYLDDLSITDNAGGISILSLTEKGCGQYRITGTGSLTYGTINVNSDHFYGSGSYIVSQDTVVFSNFEFDTDNIFRVDVRYSGNNALYSGLVLADFTMLDDTNGAVTITGVSEVSSGRYQITTTTDLTEGDISVDDSIVTGTGTYTVAIEVEFYDFYTDSDVPTYSVNCYIRTVNSQDQVNGVLAANITLSDTYNGALTVDSLTEVFPGANYELTLDQARTEGSITLSFGVYYGTSAYDFTDVTVANAGGTGTTDFTDSDLDGLADRFVHVANALSTVAILHSQTGYSGNIQTVKHTIDGGVGVGLAVWASYFKTGVNYKLRFKYSTSNSGTGYDRLTTVRVLGQLGTLQYIYNQLEPSSTYFALYESDTFQIAAGVADINLRWTFRKVGMTLWLDEIELIEV
jgi:hypothetical protein